ncbi:Sulfite exporter TauE/SafE [Novipirellula galeiformis]|uniref:Probable membrane transporter protein n=1 Tax=Novipirellula galeiformis TaxID=2528004 RepID=A0A5C6CDG3_9BACT|nr:sulfite exporter TauE/SafE family protein [Novipirellula galeiformis]TWU22182.1 Sulfite exporter TauE/SafE [Novipirellula galeiformis]
MNDLVSMLPFALILCVGIFVQSAAGFAAGLLIVPALMWCGYSIPEAQTALLVATIPQNIWGVWSLRDVISFSKLRFPGIARIVFLPLGIGVLRTLESYSVITLRQVVGAVVIAVTLATAVFNPKPRTRLHPGWAWLSFPLSGFLQGLVGMGGPAMVFWVQAHDWDTRRIRGFLFAMYLISILPALGFLYTTFGTRIVQPGMIAAAITPVLLLVTFAGLRFGNWLGRERLRRVTLALLLVMGVAGLAAPWLSVR